MSGYTLQKREVSGPKLNFFTHRYAPPQLWNDLPPGTTVTDSAEVFELLGMIRTTFHVIAVSGAPTVDIHVQGTLDGITWDDLPDAAAHITALGIFEVSTPVAAIRLRYTIGTAHVQVRAMATRGGSI